MRHIGLLAALVALPGIALAQVGPAPAVQPGGDGSSLNVTATGKHGGADAGGAGGGPN